MQKIGSFYLSILQVIVNFRVLQPDCKQPFLTMPIPKTFIHLLMYVNLYQHAQNHLIPSVRSSDTVSFRVQRPDWPHPFLTMPNQRIFNELLTFINFYQHAKNEAVSQICSGEIVDLKILQSDWLGAFCSISQEQDFSQIQDFCRNTAIIQNLIMEQIQLKLMTKFFFTFKKSYFWPISPIFGENAKIQRNLKIQFQENTLTGQDRRMYRPYFIGPLWLLLQVQQVQLQQTDI